MKKKKTPGVITCVVFDLENETYEVIPDNLPIGRTNGDEPKISYIYLVSFFKERS